MWSASVETDSGEQLVIRLPNGTRAGKGLLAFISGLWWYCEDNNRPEAQWFIQLDKYSEMDLCNVSHYILQSWYSGDWNYAEDEFLFYSHRYPNSLVESEFELAINQAKLKWVQTDQLMECVNALLALFQKARLPSDEAWFDFEATPLEFEALYTVLSFFKQRDAKLVRIRID